MRWVSGAERIAQTNDSRRDVSGERRPPRGREGRVAEDKWSREKVITTLKSHIGYSNSLGADWN
jgi:hypothetical protein